MIKDILYITTFSASTEIEKIRMASGQNPGYAIQKFSRLLSEGFVANGINLHTLSVLPVSRKTSNKLLWKPSDTEEKGVKFHHIPFINLPIIRQICLYGYSIPYIMKYCMTHRKDKVVFCDALTRSVCLAAICICHLFGVRCVGIVTDMPGMVTKKVGNSLVANIIKKINFGFIKEFDALIFMTKYMNNVLNKKNKPYIVMEGSVDISAKNMSVNRTPQRTRDIVYAGCLHERHGLKLLVEAFTRLPQEDIRLVLFGDGPFSKKLKQYSDNDNRIIYRGVVPNDAIIKAEQNAYLLINPRPIHEAFVYYSFPSKNHEYMVSGTAVATTKLPCITEEYDPYLYYLTDISVDGFYNSLNNLLSLSKEELQQKGESCRKFVLENKNNVYQTKRILNLMNSL